jgi:hypothetical protein
MVSSNFNFHILELDITTQTTSNEKTDTGGRFSWAKHYDTHQLNDHVTGETKCRLSIGQGYIHFVGEYNEL